MAEAERTALTAVVAELEGRPMSQFRTLREPAVAAELRAEELGDTELAHRARLLQIGVLLREGHSADGGRNAHQVLAWAERNGSPYLVARAHREHRYAAGRLERRGAAWQGQQRQQHGQQRDPSQRAAWPHPPPSCCRFG